MQDCFRQHPEMYGSELEDDEEEVEEELRARESASAPGDVPAESSSESTEIASTAVEEEPERVKVVEEPHHESLGTTAETAQKLGDEGGELVPKSAHDATSK
jgi:intermembrane space import and assembly protein 40